jgi:transaldolase
MPEPTLQATFDHGVIPTDSVRGMYADAQGVLDALRGLGIDYDDVVRVLEEEGVEKFETAWTELIDSVQKELTAKASA